MIECGAGDKSGQLVYCTVGLIETIRKQQCMEVSEDGLIIESRTPCEKILARPLVLNVQTGLISVDLSTKANSAC